MTIVTLILSIMTIVIVGVLAIMRDDYNNLKTEVNRLNDILIVDSFLGKSEVIKDLRFEISYLNARLNNLPVNKIKVAQEKIEEAKKIMEEIDND